MAAGIYALCAATSIVCALLLVRAWSRDRVRLLMWVALGFVGFAVNNVLLFVDEAIAVHSDLHLLRQSSELTAMCVLLFGLIWESQ